MKKTLAVIAIVLGLLILGFGVGNDLRLGYRDSANAAQMAAEGDAENAAWLQGLANDSMQRGWMLTVLGLVLTAGGVVAHKKS